MSTSGKYVDIDDYENIENIIKKFDPSYNDITKYMPGMLSNFAQQQMSMGIGNKPDNKFKLFLKAKGKNGKHRLI